MYSSEQEVRKAKRSALSKKKQIIQNNKALRAYFDIMFGILRALGFYTTKRGLQKDDIEVGKLLGISGEMVKRYRIREGYFPPKEIQDRLIELQKLSKIEIKIKKDTRIK